MAGSKKSEEGGAKKMSRMTMKDVAGVIDENDLVEDKSKGLARFYGSVTKFRVGEGKNGNEWIEFRGSFQGVSLVTGETFASDRLFLPAGATETLYERCAALAVGGEAKGVGQTTRLTEAVEFAFDIGAYYEKTSPTRYLFEVHDHMDDGKEEVKTATDRIGSSLPAPEF